MISAYVCFEELNSNCNIKVGIVELISREEMLLFFESRPSGGLVVMNGGLNDAAYMINTKTSSPFLDAYTAKATFYTPSPTPSSLVLLSKTSEYIDRMCSLKISEGNTATLLNHTEYVLEKILLIVPIDADRDVKTAAIVIRFLYFAVVDTDCSEGTSQIVYMNGEHDVQFIQGEEMSPYVDALQAMADDGWEEHQRQPILPPRRTRWMEGRCTIDPFDDVADVPRCDTETLAETKEQKDEL